MKQIIIQTAENSVEMSKAHYVCPSATIYTMDLEGVIAASDVPSSVEDMPEEDW